MSAIDREKLLRWIKENAHSTPTGLDDIVFIDHLEAAIKAGDLDDEDDEGCIYMSPEERQRAQKRVSASLRAMVDDMPTATHKRPSGYISRRLTCQGGYGAEKAKR